MIQLNYGPSDQMFALADLCFGKNFFTPESLLEMQEESPQTICLFSNDTLIGFCLLLLSPSANRIKSIFKDGSANTAYLSGALLKTIATHPAHRGKGIATRLMKEGVSLLVKKNQTSCLTIAWKEDSKINLESVLQKNGFSYLLKLEAYWKEDSVRRQYNCSACGTPPCRCSAYLFGTFLCATQEDKTL